MFLLDTNILVYAANRNAAEHPRAAGLLAAWRRGGEPFFVTWPVVYEFLRVSTHGRVSPRPLSFAAALAFLGELMATPTLAVLVATPQHWAVLNALQRDFPDLSGNRMHDLHIVALMREHRIADIRTCDAGSGGSLFCGCAGWTEAARAARPAPW